MIDIISERGESYRFDPETGRIFRDGVVVPSSKAEPAYSDPLNPSLPPRFSGIFFRETMMLLTLSGRYNRIVDPNTVL